MLKEPKECRVLENCLGFKDGLNFLLPIARAWTCNRLYFSVYFLIYFVLFFRVVLFLKMHRYMGMVVMSEGSGGFWSPCVWTYRDITL